MLLAQFAAVWQDTGFEHCGGAERSVLRVVTMALWWRKKRRSLPNGLDCRRFTSGWIWHESWNPAPRCQFILGEPKRGSRLGHANQQSL